MRWIFSSSCTRVESTWGGLRQPRTYRLWETVQRNYTMIHNCSLESIVFALYPEMILCVTRCFDPFNLRRLCYHLSIGGMLSAAKAHVLTIKRGLPGPMKMTDLAK